MTPFGLQRLPGSILFGRGTRASLAETVAGFGVRAAVVVDPFIATTPAFADALAGLDGRGVTALVLAEFEAELPVGTVQRVAAEARAFEPDVVVGFGGGSALDLAKTVALLVSHPGTLERFYGENQVPGDILPIVAVPTTAGTGSEVTPVAVVADPERTLKVGVSDPRLIPRAAIVDPDLSTGAPASVTAYAGADALVHALESATSRQRPFPEGRPPVFVGRNRLSTLLAIEAAAAIGPALPAAVADGADLDARDAMAWGSMLAGMAFGSAGTHLAHALQYPIGALTHTPHGLGTGLLVPYVLQAAVEAARGPLAEIAAAWGVAGDDEAASAQAAVDRTAEIIRASGIPVSLAEIGVAEGDLDGIAELALGVARLIDNSPLPADLALLRGILQAAYDGDRARLAPTAAPLIEERA